MFSAKSACSFSTAVGSGSGAILNSGSAHPWTIKVRKLFASKELYFKGIITIHVISDIYFLDCNNRGYSENKHNWGYKNTENLCCVIYTSFNQSIYIQYVRIKLQ